MDFSFVDTDGGAKIKVIGIGGGGGNAVNNMIDSNLQGVRFIVANTDAQALGHSRANTKIQLGERLTEGLGAGADPSMGREAALESADLLREALKDSHMVFIAAGLGGGTGTGAAPVVAEICKELGALTVAVVTRPFKFEARKRSKQADDGIAQLRKFADTVITIPNDRLRGLAKKNATLLDMFKMADEILHHSVKGITDLIMNPGLINLDFADVKTIMSKSGMAIMGIGVASGDNRAIEAAEKAISHPLLEDNSISGAKGVLMNITCSSELTMEEAIEASERIYNEIGDDDVEIIWGTAMDDSVGDEMRITVIATGIGEPDTGMKTKSPHVSRKPVRDLQDVTRGVVRDYTDADREYEGRLDQPGFYRVKKGRADRVDRTDSRGDGLENYEMKRVSNGYDDIVDMDVLDVPTFLRRKAD